MTFLDLKGRKKTIKNIRRYVVGWNKPTRSKFQDAAKRFFYPYWKSDIVLEECPLVGSLMKFDFVNVSKKIIAEISGQQHCKHVPHFHGKNPVGKFLGQIKRDMKKHEFADLNGYQLVEIYSEKELTYEFFLDKGIEL